MSPQTGVASTQPTPQATRPWAILPLGTFAGLSSTTTRLGRPLLLPDASGLIPDFAGVIAATGLMGPIGIGTASPLWRLGVTSTETGITYPRAPQPASEEVRTLRDEVARRTRLTREQIARAVGVDRRSLSGWAKGETTVAPERLERLELLAAIARDIDATEPGRATDVLLAREGDQDLLDRIAAGRISHPSDWRRLRGAKPSVVVVRRSGAKRKLHEKALEAYLRGELPPLGRTHIVRPETDYQQDLAEAADLLPDEPERRSRRGYR